MNNLRLNGSNDCFSKTPVRELNNQIAWIQALSVGLWCSLAAPDYELPNTANERDKKIYIDNTVTDTTTTTTTTKPNHINCDEIAIVSAYLWCELEFFFSFNSYCCVLVRVCSFN